MRTRAVPSRAGALLTLLLSFPLCAHALPPGNAQGLPTAGPASSTQPNLAQRATEKDRTVQVTLFPERPTIDGMLDDAVWQRAARLTDFVQTQPGDNTRPTRGTEVLFGYDAHALYIGVLAADEPGKVRATVAKRDDVLNDDHVRVFLDTFNDRRRAYLLVFNPLGVQQDGIWTEGRDPDYSVDVIMDPKGVLSESGYAIEIAIPFRSLRYEAGRGRRWGVHVTRRIKHENDEEDSWMPLIRGEAGFLTQAGHITGLEQLAARRSLEIIPSLTASQSGTRVRGGAGGVGSATGFAEGPARGDAGLSAKLGITSAVTADLALNPDFAQVEADQAVVTANQRFPLFFEEKRPFFLEGADLFETPLRVVHTRTIIDPVLALKVSGKRGGTAFGLMVTRDEAPGNFSQEERNDPALYPTIAPLLDKNAGVGMLRIRRDVGRQSSVGMIAAGYDFVAKNNVLAGVDGRLALGAQSVLTFQVVGSIARRPFYSPDLDRELYRKGKGLGYVAQYRRSGRHFSAGLTGEGRSPDYVADAGFTRQTNTNIWGLETRFDSEPRPHAPLISWSVAHTGLTQFDWQGRMKYAYVYPRLLLNFRRQTFLNVHAYTDYLRLLEEEFGPRRSVHQRGAFSGDSERSTVYKGFPERLLPPVDLSDQSLRLRACAGRLRFPPREPAHPGPGRLDPEPGDCPVSWVQRRPKPERVRSFHREVRAGTAAQRPRLLRQDVVPVPARDGRGRTRMSRPTARNMRWRHVRYR